MSQEITTNLEKIIKLLVPDGLEFQIEITDPKIGTGKLVKVIASSDHLGKIIGSGGKTAQGLREMVFIYNKIHNTDYALEIESLEEAAE